MPRPVPVAPQVAAAPLPAAGETVRGILLMIAFAAIAPGIDIFAKLATAHVPPAEVALARFVLQAGLLVPVIALYGWWPRFTAGRLGLHALRGLLIGVATIMFMTALRAMPVADAISIFFVEPLILTLLSGWLLGEAVGWRRLTACAVGFAGAMIVVRPSFHDLGPVTLLPLVTATCFAFYLLLTRRLARDENPVTMQATAGIFGGLCVALALWVGEGTGSDIFDPHWPSGVAWAQMAGVGAAATVSHLFLVFAFRAAPAAVLAPLQYLEIVSATLFGYLVFGDFPDALKWLGIGTIVGSGLFVFWRERRAGRHA